jgi:hypothetical protein
MNTELEWSYVSKLNDFGSIDKFEQENSVKLPADLKNTIKEYNYGQPSRCVFDTDKSTGNVFGALLSFNESDSDNIFVYYPIVNAENKSLIPFAADPFGNYLCLMNDKVVFWDHETNTTEFVALSFTELLSKLYSN